VQQGAELAYLLRHDPDFRCVRREHLIEAGKQVRLKQDIKRFVECLDAGVDSINSRSMSFRPRPERSSSPRSRASFPRTISTARSVNMTRPPARSAPSRGCQLVMGKWRS
jgi:hypothetical protein